MSERITLVPGRTYEVPVTYWRTYLANGTVRVTIPEDFDPSTLDDLISAAGATISTDGWPQETHESSFEMDDDREPCEVIPIPDVVTRLLEGAPGDG